MSVYYYLGCDKCKERVPFVGAWAGGVRFMNGHEEIPAFFQDHYFCEKTESPEQKSVALSIFNEHDERADSYTCKFEDEFEEKPPACLARDRRSE